VLADEALTLDEAKVADGTTLHLERGRLARRGETTLRFKPVAGNDRGPKWSAAGGGRRGVEREVTVKDACTVAEAKAAMISLLEAETAAVISGGGDGGGGGGSGADGGGGGGERRLRVTNWAEEPGLLVDEVFDGGDARSLKEAGLVGFRECLLLEEGRVPLKGELRLSFLLWSPHPETAPIAHEAAADGDDEADAGAAAKVDAVGEPSDAYELGRTARMGCFKRLFELDTHADLTLDSLLLDTAERLLAAAADEGNGGAGTSAADSELATLAARVKARGADGFGLREIRSDWLPGSWLLEKGKTLGR
jgi:hypothetical protein